MNEMKYVIGIDYGTDSVRALLVNANNGEELAVSVFEYPRWKKGLYCHPAGNQFRQHPLDYIEGLEFTVREVPVYVSQLPELREAFMVSTSRDVVPVTRIDATVIGDGKPGPVTKSIMNAFRDYLASY